MKNFSLLVSILALCIVTQIEADDSLKLFDGYKEITSISKSLVGKLEVAPSPLGCKYYNGKVKGTVINKGKKSQVYTPVFRALYNDCQATNFKGGKKCDPGKVIQKGKSINIAGGSTKKIVINIPVHSYTVAVITDEKGKKYRQCKIDNRKPIY